MSNNNLKSIFIMKAIKTFSIYIFNGFLAGNSIRTGP